MSKKCVCKHPQSQHWLGRTTINTFDYTVCDKCECTEYRQPELVNSK